MMNFSDIPYEDHLCAYSCKTEISKGRKYPELPHPFRNPYQRDRDRIVHSRAFRRLEYKTQVLVNHLGDHYRTRLTHSIEVSLVSRSIARVLNIHEDLCEALAMGHDLGHPPFGHAGERILNTLMKEEGGFDHNYQSLRIVEQLENRYPQFTGLNLSYEVRQGLLKHAHSDTLKYYIDPNEFDTIHMPFLEAQVVDLSDEITYSCHDLEDGITHSYISFHEAKKLQIWKHVENFRLYSRKKNAEEVVLYHLIRSLIDTLVKDTVQNTKTHLQKHNIKTVSDIKKHKSPLVELSSDMKTAFDELQHFLSTKFYQHPYIETMTQTAEEVLSGLFNFYVQNPKELPENSWKRIREKNSIKRVVCDYLAGMTDRYALEEHKRRKQ